MKKINILEKAKAISQSHFNEIISEVNDHCVRLAVNKKSTFNWHHHKDSDEILLVIEGELIVEYQSGQKIILNELDSLLIPKGTIHRTIANQRTVNLCFEKTEDSTIFVEN